MASAPGAGKTGAFLPTYQMSHGTSSGLGNSIEAEVVDMARWIAEKHATQKGTTTGAQA
jgi:hypothetical protein